MERETYWETHKKLDDPLLSGGAVLCGLEKKGNLSFVTTRAVESRVAKHTPKDTQDNGVQFITPAGPRGISSQQGP